MSRLRVAATGILAVLVLSGCAPTDVTAPNTAPVASPSSTPSPTPSAPVAPQAILPLACSDLFSAEEASALVLEDLAVVVDETLARNSGEIRLRQAGMLGCVWGGERSTSSWWQKLEVRILADAEAEFDVGVWQIDDGAVVYPAGSTTSEYLCPYVDDRELQCFANVLVNGFWAHAELQNIGGSGGLTQAIAEESMRTIVNRLTERMAQAGPGRPAWAPPVDALRGQICGGQVADRDVESVDLRNPESVVWSRTAEPECELTAASGIDYSVTVYVGGGWALPRMVERLEHPGGLVSLPRRIDIEGVEFAWAACGENCLATFEVGSSAVTVYSSVASREAGLTDDEFVADVASLVPHILAAG